MFSKIIASPITAALAMSSLVTAAPRNQARKSANPTSEPELSVTAQLRLADTAADRYLLLPDDEDFVFDFNKSDTGLATSKSFPALVGTTGALAVAKFPPCSMASLHIHPRAAELFVVLSGHVYTEMAPESGVVTANGTQRVVRTDLRAEQMTVFPMGSLHTQINPDCEPALVVASFTSEDPGASLVAANTFALTDDFITGTFGGIIIGEDIDKVRHAIPQGAIFTLEECVKKCGGKKRQA